MSGTEPHDTASGTSSFTARFTALLEPLGGRTALVARRTGTPRQPRPALLAADEHSSDSRDEVGSIAIRPDDVFPAASLAKIPIAIELLRRTDFGQFDLAEHIDTSSEPRVGGGGVLDYLDPTTRLTLDDLCFLMIGVSDNTAANFLLDLVGMGEVNETLSRLNLTHTRLARRFMDFAARAAHRDNVTTAADMAALHSLARGNALPGAARLRQMLASQQLDEDLKSLLPAEAQLAHKTGSLEGLFHDAGILTGPAGACVYCMLTAEQASVPLARMTVSRVLRELWDEWCVERESAESDQPDK